MVNDFGSSGLRVGDADREAAMTALGEHLSAGRVDIDEYGDRTARVSSAKTRRELLAVFDDLPEPRPKLAGEEEPPAQAAPPRRAGGGLRRSLAALVPLSWLAATVVGVFGQYWMWLVFVVPVALTALWGGGAGWVRRSASMENWMDFPGQDPRDWGDPAQWGMGYFYSGSDRGRHDRDAQRHDRDAARRDRAAARRDRDAARRNRRVGW
ncbi:DUF1707 domain-containing protein [Amycolatopsis acidiphila]|nr:DUF1707 domain-containing protein [Amycolatopsis acidiphila]UIJ62063.1 DUF1707 domain-containing protein [Amycolatopsis acidiphila]GHG99473.1 hypothetical protein GCM10017788_80030 [Amycolatopsis acidiphila]